MKNDKYKNYNITINGSYGRTNSGDDAILFSIINQIREIKKEANITVLSLNPKETIINYNANSIYTFNILKLNRLLKKCDLFISGGGTLLQNVTSTRSLLYYLYMIKKAKRNNCKVILYGCGIGPIKGKTIRNITTKILNKYVDNILLRDSSSYEELKRLNINLNKVVLGIDPSFLLNNYINLDNKILSKLNIDSNKKYVGVCIKKYNKKFLCEMIKVINYLYKKDFIPVFIPMDYKEDLPILKELSSNLNIPYHIVDINISFDMKYSLISKMDLIIGMRLHSIIFAYLTNVKVIGISYDQKNNAFCKDYNIKNLININEFNYNKFINEFNKLKLNKVNSKKINELNQINVELLNNIID